MGPKGVAVDKNGHIITADNKACCVFIFQSNGKLVTKFGAKGTSERQFAGNVSYFLVSCATALVVSIYFMARSCFDQMTLSVSLQTKVLRIHQQSQSRVNLALPSVRIHFLIFFFFLGELFLVVDCIIEY